MSDVTKRLSSLHEARDAFFNALKVHEHSIYKIGYEDGYAAGWEAAVNRLSEVRPEANLATSGPTDLSHLLHQRTEEVPAHEAILDVIKPNPGLKRQEIIDIARKTLPNLNERTVRTALQRMKNAGELTVVDSKWYLADKQDDSAESAEETCTPAQPASARAGNARAAK